MTHVFRVEPVVSQFIHNYFVCREIVCFIRMIPYGRIHTEKKGCLAELVAVSSVLEMSDRTDCEDEFLFCESGFRSSAFLTGFDDVFKQG